MTDPKKNGFEGRKEDEKIQLKSKDDENAQ